MTTSGDDKGRARTGRTDCAECGAALTEGQRYCLRCGARHGELPAAVAGQLPAMLARKRGEELPVADEPEVEAPAEPVAEERNYAAVSAYMPSPRVAAVAVLGMLGLGVLLGSATSQFAQSAGLTSILLEAEPPPPAAEPAEEEEFTEEEVPEVEEAPEAIPSSVPELPPPAEEVPEPAPPPEPPPDPPAEEPLPEVKHLFLVVLGENGFEETFGKTSPAPYLNTTLPAEGELLPNYFAVAQGGLANQIALLSGQGPTAETTAGCPTYADVAPATVSAEGQVEGNGCVYPSTTPSLPAQLTKAKLKWKAYVEDIGNGAAAGQPPTCRHPALGSQDPNQTPMPGDAYLTPRNPFVYFHSIVDDPRCTETDVALSQLAPDLAKAKTTPTLSYIVPNACHDGGPQPCEEGKAAGPLAVEEFLKALLPVITASPAYKEGGLIAITSGQAPQTGESPDTSSCCISPAYPNLPPPAAETVSGPVKPTGGGGKVGLLLLSQFVKPGTVDESTYSNHYTLLLSIEELFGLEPIGYAGDPALVGFEPSVYNAGEEESTTVKKRAAQSKRISSAVSRPSPTAATERVRSAQGADSAKRPSSSALSTAAR